MRFYYGTIPSIVYIINHFFFGAKHYAWLAGEYYPYRRANPKSSNPHLIYQDLYQAWTDLDDFDKFILQFRLNMRAGVILQGKRLGLSDEIVKRLKKVCDEVCISTFYPIVYRVDVENICPERLEKQGSGLKGSWECLIRDLTENEINDIHFIDCHEDDELISLVRDEFQYFRSNNSYKINPWDALLMLEKRCLDDEKRRRSKFQSTKDN